MRFNHFGIFLKTLRREWRNRPLSHWFRIYTTQIWMGWLIASHTRYARGQRLRHFHTISSFRIAIEVLVETTNQWRMIYIVNEHCPLLHCILECWRLHFFLLPANGAMEFFRVIICVSNHHQRYFALAWCMWKGLARNTRPSAVIVHKDVRIHNMKTSFYYYWISS